MPRRRDIVEVGNVERAVAANSRRRAGGFMFKKLMIVAGLGCIFAASTHQAVAGPFADDMAKCMVNSTSVADRADLVRWMFSAMVLNPDLASMASIPAKERDELATKAANLFSRLMFDSCKSQVQQAVRNEGPQTIAYAFQILGEVAARGIMADPHVTQSLQALGKSIDQTKLKSLMAAAGK